MRVTRKQKVMRGGLTPEEIQQRERQQRELIKLASRLTNQIFERNRYTFYNTIYPQGIREGYINIIGPDFDPVRDYPTNLLVWVVGWHTHNRDYIPPWHDYVGKLCEVPEGFFANNEERPRGNLQNVKQNLDNFDPTFPRDPTNDNIVEISVNILGPADQEKAVDKNGIEIPPDKYKYVVLSDDEIRYVPDTGTLDPCYYFPSVILYFYNQKIISFEELKSYLGNELPHSLLFNARTEELFGAGVFTVDANGYIVELTGYSGHTKPLPPNVIYSAVKFNELGYHLVMNLTNQFRLQTGNTNRSDHNDRLLGNYLSLKYSRPT